MAEADADAPNGLHVVVTKRKKARCDHCRGRMTRLTGEVHDEHGIAAMFVAALYTHDGVRDVFIDAVLGSWESDDYADHVTITTRTGPVEPDGHIASTLIDGGASQPDEPFFGRKISREEGLASPQLPTYWAISDAVVSQVGEIDRHLYGS